MKLSECPIGSKFRVMCTLLQDRKTCQRIQEIGLCNVRDIVVIQDAVFGGKILKVGESRIAVDNKTANLIKVEKA